MVCLFLWGRVGVGLLFIYLFGLFKRLVDKYF